MFIIISLATRCDVIVRVRFVFTISEKQYQFRGKNLKLEITIFITIKAFGVGEQSASEVTCKKVEPLSER